MIGTFIWDPSSNTWVQNGGQVTPGGRDDVTSTIRPVRKRDKCANCDAEWCEELDAYYGVDLVLGMLCSKCRRKMRHP